jgi:5-methylcytosine-specific restriction endonuclease McrA
MKLEVDERDVAPELALERAVWAWRDGEPNPFDAATPAVRVCLLTRHRWRAAYELYLRSAAWHDKRVAVLRRAGQRCECCGRGGGILAAALLEVHHWSYDALGDEPLAQLEALCPRCHEDADRQRLDGHLPERVRELAAR